MSIIPIALDDTSQFIDSPPPPLMHTQVNVVHLIYTFRPCFHEVTVVRKIVTQSECNFFHYRHFVKTATICTVHKMIFKKMFLPV